MQTIKITGSTVEFRNIWGRTTEVVKVFFSGRSPRIMAYSQDDESRILPLSLHLSEINDYVAQAQKELDSVKVEDTERESVSSYYPR